MAVPIKFRRPAPRMRSDPGRQHRVNSPFTPREMALGTVGYSDNRTALPEGTPAWLRWEQGELLVEVTLEDEDRISARLSEDVGTLTEGQQVVLHMPGGEPNAAIIIAKMNSSIEPAPSSVAGVSTGAGSATEKGTRLPGATWQFVRLDDGRMLAIQTNDQDINIWAGAGVHMKATTGAIHLDGTTHLGASPTTAPIGSTATMGGEEIPGVPAVPFVPAPYIPPTPSPSIPPAPPPTPTPYVGLEDGIVRARDVYEATPLTDPYLFAWLAGVGVAAGFPSAPPLRILSAVSGSQGPGSKHTATGDVGEAG